MIVNGKSMNACRIDCTMILLVSCFKFNFNLFSSIWSMFSYNTSWVYLSNHNHNCLWRWTYNVYMPMNFDILYKDQPFSDLYSYSPHL